MTLVNQSLATAKAFFKTIYNYLNNCQFVQMVNECAKYDKWERDWKREEKGKMKRKMKSVSIAYQFTWCVNKNLFVFTETKTKQFWQPLSSRKLMTNLLTCWSKLGLIELLFWSKWKGPFNQLRTVQSHLQLIKGFQRV